MEGDRGRPPPIVNKLLSAVPAVIFERGVGLLVPFVCGLAGVESGPADVAEEKLLAAVVECERERSEIGLLSWLVKLDWVGLIPPLARTVLAFATSIFCNGETEEEMRLDARMDSMTSRSPLGSTPFIAGGTPKPARIDLPQSTTNNSSISSLCKLRTMID